MSIQIEVPLSAVQKPAVATALADLVRALGGRSRARSNGITPGPAGVARRRPAPVIVQPEYEGIPPDQRWNRYVAALPERSRRFLELLEQRGQLNVGEAVELLDLPGPKAMGGLTGAMRRWAPRKGVDLPFRATKDGRGQRCWVWTGRTA